MAKKPDQMTTEEYQASTAARAKQGRKASYEEHEAWRRYMEANGMRQPDKSRNHEDFKEHVAQDYDLTDQIILGLRKGQSTRSRAQTGRTRASAFGSPYQYGGQYPILLGGS